MTRRKLERAPGLLGGVAAGAGNYLDVDPAVIRVGFAFLSFFRGLGIFFYLACWLILPDEEGTSWLQRLVQEGQMPDHRLAGAALVLLGLVWLLGVLMPPVLLPSLGGLALVAAGILIIFRNGRK